MSITLSTVAIVGHLKNVYLSLDSLIVATVGHGVVHTEPKALVRTVDIVRVGVNADRSCQ